LAARRTFAFFLVFARPAFVACLAFARAIALSPCQNRLSKKSICVRPMAPDGGAQPAARRLRPYRQLAIAGRI
jgi:hypothetical protein